MAIFKVKDRKEAEKMSEEIQKLKLENVEAAIIQWGLEGTTKGKINKAVGRITGTILNLASLNAKESSALVRLAKEDYYKLIRESPERIACKYLSIRYEKLISVKNYKKCGKYGHSEDRC